MSWKGSEIWPIVLQAASARDFLNAGALEAAPRGRDLLKLAESLLVSLTASRRSETCLIYYEHLVRYAGRNFRGCGGARVVPYAVEL